MTHPLHVPGTHDMFDVLRPNRATFHKTGWIL